MIVQQISARRNKKLTKPNELLPTVMSLSYLALKKLYFPSKQSPEHHFEVQSCCQYHIYTDFHHGFRDASE